MVPQSPRARGCRGTNGARVAWCPPITSLQEEEGAVGMKDHPAGAEQAMESPAALMRAQKRQRMERHKPRLSLVVTHCPACSGSAA